MWTNKVRVTGTKSQRSLDGLCCSTGYSMQESSTEWPQHTVSAFSLLARVGHPAWKTAFTVTRLFRYQTGTKTDPEHPLVPRSLHPSSLLASSVHTIQLIPRLPSRTAKERQGRNTACRYPWAGQVSCGGRAECQGTCHAETALLYPHCKITISWQVSFK